MNNLRPFAERASCIFETIDWLKNKYGLIVRPQSPLEHIMGLVQGELAACQHSSASASGLLTSAQTRAVRGLERLCERLQRARDTTTIPPQFKTWIKRIEVGIPSLCSPYSDFPKAVRGGESVRQASSDIFELVVGLVALEMGKNVLLESRNPQGKPDVRVEIENIIWGFACRVSNSASPVRHFGCLVDAANKTVCQLDAGLADRAIIVLSVQNPFSRGQVILPDFKAAKETLKKRVDEFSENVQNAIPPQRILDELIHRDSRILPGAVAYFEEVFEIGSVDTVHLPDQPPVRVISIPVSHAQYITFGKRGLELTDVPKQLALALAGPNTEDIDA